MGVQPRRRSGGYASASVPRSEMRPPPPSATAPRPTDPEPFTAWCYCPRCGYFDCHWLEAPNKYPPRLIQAEGETVTTYSSWGYERVVRSPAKYDRPDERMFSTMRRCRARDTAGNLRCQYRWGQV